MIELKKKMMKKIESDQNKKKLKEKKVLGFMNTKNKLIPTIPQTEFVRFKDKKELKKLGWRGKEILENPKRIKEIRRTLELAQILILLCFSMLWL